MQIWNWAFRPTQFLRHCAARYGDAFTLRFPHYDPIVMISEPTAIAEVFRDPGDLRSGEGNRLFEPLLGPNSLILMDGAAHRRERKLLMPMFHGDRMRAYAATMLRVAEDRLDRWPESGRLPIHTEMQSITLLYRRVGGSVIPAVNFGRPAFR